MAANVNETSAATAAKTVKKPDGKLKGFLKYCKKNPAFTLGLLRSSQFSQSRSLPMIPRSTTPRSC